MKKQIFLMAIATCLCSFAHAQTPMVNPNGYALDTATQAAPEGAYLKVPAAKKTVSIVVATTKISGTIAGTVSWQGSNNGTAYYTISTSALVDASTVYGYKETDKAFLFYRALITQTGTSSLSYSAIAYATGQPTQ